MSFSPRDGFHPGRRALTDAPPLETLPSQHSAVVTGRHSQALARGPGLRSALGPRSSVGPAGTPASAPHATQAVFLVPTWLEGRTCVFYPRGRGPVSSGMQRSSARQEPAPSTCTCLTAAPSGTASTWLGFITAVWKEDQIREHLVFCF